jgi:hypothetical protein
MPSLELDEETMSYLRHIPYAILTAGLFVAGSASAQTATLSFGAGAPPQLSFSMPQPAYAPPVYVQPVPVYAQPMYGPGYGPRPFMHPEPRFEHEAREFYRERHDEPHAFDHHEMHHDGGFDHHDEHRDAFRDHGHGGFDRHEGWNGHGPVPGSHGAPNWQTASRGGRDGDRHH